MRTSLRRVALGAVAVAAAVGACSATPAVTSDTGAGGEGPSATTGGHPTSSSTSPSTGPGTLVGGGSPGAGGAGGSSAAGIGGGCAGVVSQAVPVPLDIFLMLDQSGSMLMDAGNGMSRWETIQSAMTQFIADPDNVGIGMGVQYFGLPNPTVHGCAQQPCAVDTDCMGGCTSCAQEGVCQSQFDPDVDSCDPDDYAWAEVPIATLPGAGNEIVSSIAAHTPGTNTPTMPALAGAIQFAKAHETANPSHITVVAYATDGGPSECDTDLNDIDAVAATGFMTAPSIKTFVIGVGPNLGALDGIAASGGTTAAYHVDLDPMATDSLLAYLNDVRSVGLACTYELPPPPDGMTLDPGLVNVQFDPGSASPTVYPKVDDAAACPATGDGWYYDDTMDPPTIVLCPSTCAGLAHLVGGEVDISVGCTTIIH